MNNKLCVFAGTFDPFTLGHEKVVEYCKKDFERVIIAVMINKEKSPYFTLEERLDFINTIYRGDNKISVTYYDGMLVDFLKREGTPFTVRGIRNEEDLAYEKAMVDNNRSMMPEIKTVMYNIDECKDVSSTLVRKKMLGKDLYKYVNAKILPKIRKILAKSGKQQ